MKFVIKSGSSVKLFSGEMKIEALAQFLKENFGSWDSNNLTYTDDDGDKITLATQEDLDALLSLYSNSQYLKLEISEDKPKPSLSPIKTQATNVEKIEETKAQEVKEGKKSIKKISNSKPKSPRKIKDDEGKRRDRKCWSRKRRSPSKSIQKSEKSRDSGSSTENAQKLEGLIYEKVSQMVDQRIKSLIPCIKNQLEEKSESKLIQNQTGPEHAGVACNGCNLNPISGIRYKCLECPNFNLCCECQTKIEHEHNLLKIKKPEANLEKTETKDRDLYKLGKRMLKGFRRHDSSSESSKEGHHHKHRHWRGKHRHNSQERDEWRLNKKIFKLKALFGEREDLKEFIEKNPELRAKELADVYVAQNNISFEEYQEKRNLLKKEKLSAFFDCPQEEFDEVVKQYSDLGFRDIIMKLKQSGKRTYTGENFKKMREKFRCNRMVEKESRPEEKRVSSPKRTEKSRSKGRKSKEANEILSEMTSLFGEEHGQIMRDFIEANMSLGKQGIIARWIEENCV